MKVKYREFYQYLSGNGCKDSEIRHLYGAVKAMDRESRQWFLVWFNRGIYPSRKVEGVTVKYLVEECGFQPVNAFIIIDWLKSDPDAAKYFVMKRSSTIPPGDEIGAEVEAILEREGRKLSDAPEGADLTDMEE